MTKITSKRIKRQNKILSKLEVDPALRVNELASALDVSAETVRRDLAELDESGHIKRTYGGAVRANEVEPVLADRLKLNITERQNIAQFALSQLEGVSSIFVGGGATTLHFARALRNINRKITVLTATFNIATELATNPLIEVMCLPGIVEPNEGQVCGSETLRFIQSYKAQVAIIGASAIDEAGVSEALLSAAQIYSAMVENSDRAIVLADSSKFGTRSLQSILNWSASTSIITEISPPPALSKSIGSRGTKIFPLNEIGH